VSSFDAPRVRPAPNTISGTSLDSVPLSKTLVGLTLIVAVKQNCDGCRDFIFSELNELSDVPVLILSATGDDNGEWTDSLQQVIVAPRMLQELDIRWPPFYVLVDPEQRLVVTEGVVFGPAQVASEIASYFSSR
jgi:hypothetical protein